MQEDRVEAIAAAWLVRTGTEDPALRAFLAESVPDVDAWALRRLGSAGLEPQILAVSARHLYRIEAGAEDGRRGFGSERLALAEASVALLEFRGADTVRRRWTLRTRGDGLTVETEQDAGAGPPALEHVMRLVLDRAR